MSQLPPEFDDFQPNHYDPQYTADISMQMSVPDRIEVASSSDPDTLRLRPLMGDFISEQQLSEMTVPDKIVVLGHNLREEPNLHLDLVPLPNERMFVNIETPPRVITLDERKFPTLEDSQRRYFNGNRVNSEPAVTPNEVAQIQQQLTALTEHVKRLEVENSRRWHRELVFYPALLGYIFLQVARWLVINK